MAKYSETFQSSGMCPCWGGGVSGHGLEGVPLNTANSLRPTVVYIMADSNRFVVSVIAGSLANGHIITAYILVLNTMSDSILLADYNYRHRSTFELTLQAVGQIFHSWISISDAGHESGEDTLATMLTYILKN